MFCMETQFEITHAVDTVDGLSDDYSFQTALTVAITKSDKTTPVTLRYINAQGIDPFADSHVMILDRQNSDLTRAAWILNAGEIEFLRQFTQVAADQRETEYVEWHQWLSDVKEVQAA